MSDSQLEARVRLMKKLMNDYSIPLEKILRRKYILNEETGHSCSTQCHGENFKHIRLLATLKKESRLSKSERITPHTSTK